MISLQGMSEVRPPTPTVMSARSVCVGNSHLQTQRDTQREKLKVAATNRLLSGGSISGMHQYMVILGTHDG